MTGQRALINQLIKIVDRPCIPNGLLNSIFELALKIRALRHWKKKKKVLRGRPKSARVPKKKRGFKRQTHQFEGSPTGAAT